MESFPLHIRLLLIVLIREVMNSFLYSFNQSNCLFVGVECTSYSDFLQGKCNCGYNGEKCSIMGISATPKPPPRRRYYLEVAPERPYCLHQYQIVLYLCLHTVNNISKSVEIPIHLTIYGEKHKIQRKIILDIDLSISKQANKFLMTSFQHVGRIESVNISSFGNIADASTTLVKEVEVNYLHPKSAKISESRFCRSSSAKEQKKVKCNTFLSNSCH
ncbi:hypothetical protein CEXT_464941 [Caerostris extrusa]|uniref:EGF-like domain-containing protein n=1 Tax=Caerostris extrusa TaxID=172846 RepID=A0AAV4XKH2_CAEEX|nr:hypothetical protein CEXT_464941 [Caerostris extrusa]